MKNLSKNQIQRMPIYLKYFKELVDMGQTLVSSPQIAVRLGYSEEQVRKDLQAVSDEHGRPKKGRELASLLDAIEAFLGYHESKKAVVIGCGHLGRALLNYSGFPAMGLSVVAGFDVEPRQSSSAKPVYPMSQIKDVLPTLHADIAIITVPASEAQSALDLAIEAGAKAIWNFAPALLDVPAGVVIENENLSSSLAVLSYRMNQR